MHEKLLSEISQPHQKGTIECRIIRFSDKSNPIVLMRDDIGEEYRIFSEPEAKLMEIVMSHAYVTGYTVAEVNRNLDEFNVGSRYSESPDIKITSDEYGAKYILAMGLIPEIKALTPVNSGMDQGTIDFLEARFTYLLGK